MLVGLIRLEEIKVGGTIWLFRVWQMGLGALAEPEFEVELVDELLVLGVGVGEAQVGPEIVLPFKDTEPADNAIKRPSKVAPVFIAFAPFWEITVPLNAVVVSRVVELPIRHQTLQGSPPVIDDPGEVINVETVLKIQTPVPVKFKLPVKVKLLVEQ